MLEPFLGIKDKRWRVETFEELLSKDSFELISAMNDLAQTLPNKEKVNDIQLCGSLACGCSQVFSDIDFNISYSSESLQKEANLYFRNKLLDKVAPRFKERLYEIMQSLRVSIDISVGPLNKSAMIERGPIFYSCSEDRFYGKTFGEKVKTRFRYSSETDSFVKTPFIQKTHSYLESLIG